MARTGIRRLKAADVSEASASSLSPVFSSGHCRLPRASAATDWRATNLLSSRTWPRLGFRPTFLRLHRRLGH